MAHKLMVAGIDIGTKYSGYAYSFRSDFINNPLKIFANEWYAEGVRRATEKAPTTVLLTPKGEFHSFGFQAEDKYADLAEEDTHEGWFYFHRFKMRLLDKDLHRDIQITDINGKTQPARRIFFLTIDYLRKELLHKLNEKLAFEPDDIHWVITVPAIWTDASKQFMREAANEAGIKDYQLSLAYEPEAAILYCKLLSPEKLGGAESRKDRATIFNPGRKIMVLDLGGGTADVTVQEITRNKGFKQIYRASGGAWGGTKVDDDFYQFLVKIFGNSLFKFSQSNMSEYLLLFRTFEGKKLNIKRTDTNDLIISLPEHLLTLLKEESGCTLPEILSQSHFEGSVTVTSKGNRMKISHNIYKSFFKKSLENIREHIKDILSNPECFNVSVILMVGGFSESSMVIDMMQESFPTILSIVPPDARMSVLFGSVLYGHDPEQINARICEYSYGIAVHKEFKDSVHPQEKSFFMDGKKRVDDCFEKIYTINEIVDIGEKRSIPVYNTHIDNERQRWRREYKEIEIYASTDSAPKFITDPGCFKLGTILVPPPEGGLWPVKMKGRIDMKIGGTEITVTYVDESLNQTISSRIDCLTLQYIN